MALPRPDVLAVGETMVLLAPDPPRPLDETDTLGIHVAGAESNVAIGLAGLGVAAAWAGAVGDDPFGRRILRELTARGVDVRHVLVDPLAPTAVFVKDPGDAGTRVHYYRTGSAASRLTASFADRLPLDTARVVHLSGITPALSAACAELVDQILTRRRAAGLPVSFDVNHRPALWAPGEAGDRLLDLARRSDLVFVGRDEGEALWGAATPHAIRALLPAPRLVVKDGAVGAHLFEDDREAFAPALPVEVLEPVGAGDAFAAGFLAAELAGSRGVEALERGHALAARVLTTVGDLPDPARSAPTMEEAR